MASARSARRAVAHGRRLPIDFLAATVRIATPLLFGALGGILIERAGTFAVGARGHDAGRRLRGAIVVDAFSPAMLAIGLSRRSAVGGMLLAALVAVATVRFRAEQMVTGLAANILALGLTSFLLRGLVGAGQAPVIRVPTLEAWPIPVPGRPAGDRPAPVPPAAAHLSRASC